jgi:hypothetical protein
MRHPKMESDTAVVAHQGVSHPVIVRHPSDHQYGQSSHHRAKTSVIPAYRGRIIEVTEHTLHRGVLHR